MWSTAVNQKPDLSSPGQLVADPLSPASYNTEDLKAAKLHKETFETLGASTT